MAAPGDATLLTAQPLEAIWTHCSRLLLQLGLEATQQCCSGLMHVAAHWVMLCSSGSPVAALLGRTTWQGCSAETAWLPLS